MSERFISQDSNVSLVECLISEPIGERIIGLADPRLMRREEFESSLELLFHGSMVPISFSSEYDYHSEEYANDHEGSTTLGFGFYSTDDKNEAIKYSLARQNISGVDPIVISILPYQAKMLDLRQKNDTRKNGDTPRELALRWRDCFNVYLNEKLLHKEVFGVIFQSLEKRYSKYLDDVLNLEHIDLRVLLGTAPSHEVSSINFPSPPWTMLFSKFMIECGYDGVIYNEGGEGLEFSGGSSYVFYNLKKIGNYESWSEN